MPVVEVVELGLCRYDLFESCTGILILYDAAFYQHQPHRTNTGSNMFLFKSFRLLCIAMAGCTLYVYLLLSCETFVFIRSRGKSH